MHGAGRSVDTGDRVLDDAVGGPALCEPCFPAEQIANQRVVTTDGGGRGGGGELDLNNRLPKMEVAKDGSYGQI